jgi:hypothetical protein
LRNKLEAAYTTYDSKKEKVSEEIFRKQKYKEMLSSKILENKEDATK